MNGKVHVAIGVSTVACLALKYPAGIPVFGTTVVPLISLLTAAAGSYAPDVDNPRTHSGMKHKITSKVVAKTGGGHRGITHTLLFPTLLGVVMYMCTTIQSSVPYISNFLMSLIFGFNVGWIAHIIADLFNGKGCPILWPLSKSKIHILDLPSTGFVPWMFAGGVIVLEVLITIGGI